MGPSSGLALRGLPRYWRPRVSAPPLAPQHGQIVASPEQGPDMLVTVYQDGGQLIADWGDTSPFHYDRFNIRWDRDGSNAGQVTQDGASSGHWLILDDTHATDPVRSEPAT